MRLAARDRTDAAIAKPEPPFVRVDELGGQFPGMPGAPSHGQNRGLVGAADHAPRACDSAHGLTGRERAISRLAAPGSRVPSEPDPTTVSRSAPFIRSEPCVCRRVRGWDLEFESGLLQRRVCKPSVPLETTLNTRRMPSGFRQNCGTGWRSLRRPAFERRVVVLLARTPPVVPSFHCQGRPRRQILVSRLPRASGNVG